jgi:hypothetical protein
LAGSEETELVTAECDEFFRQEQAMPMIPNHLLLFPGEHAPS